MNDKETQKEKIRERYKGINIDKIDIIPAIPEENIFDEYREQRVAVYVRVSTDDPRQTSSYELQKNHYLDIVNHHPNWDLVDIYADEGISGTSLNHRDSFIRMINDCLDGKIDLIVAKSVSRFARNILDCVGYIYKLKKLQPPVGIFFEAENLYTLDKNSELAIAIIAAVAQQESCNKSEVMNASIEMRFRRGIFLTPPLLGYDKDEDGQLIINESEASIIRLIFFMYLYGYTCIQIADTLTNLGCKTKKENIKWAPGSILGILQNERYCGDVRARKTWTPDYLDHKAKKNKQNRNQYYYKDNHEAIISRDDFIAVQHFINNAKYGNKRIMPELKVINNGVLKGFVTIHPHWGGFRAKDYILASESIAENEYPIEKELNIKLPKGEFDFRGYEIARTQFFNTSGKVFMTISSKNIAFSSGCIKKFNSIPYIEMLILPQKKLFAVRPSEKDKQLSVRWSKRKDDSIIYRAVSGAAFLETIYEILEWNLLLKYRVYGTYYIRNNMPVIIFDMGDAESLIPKNYNEHQSVSNSISVSGKSIIGYPTEWIHGFGNNFYTHAQTKELENFISSGIWDADSEGASFADKEMPSISNKKYIDDKIKETITQIKKETENG